MWGPKLTLPELENLVSTGALQRQAPDSSEIATLLKSARTRLKGADNKELETANRFYLAYGSAHASAVAALRLHGYRAKNRSIVFQALQHTVGWAPAGWRVLLNAHNLRNDMDYEGVGEVDDTIAGALLAAAKQLARDVTALSKRLSAEG